MTRELRCPMRECRRRLDLDTLPPRAYPERDACMHFIAAWGGARGGIAEETLVGLDGNRELVIRNIRPFEVLASLLESQRAAMEAAIERYGHVVRGESAEGRSEGGAVFGDEFERNGIGRALARLLLGPDPMVGGR